MSVPEIGVDDLAVRLAGGAFLLDVREPDEYVEAHVPGAVLVPLGEVPDRATELPGDREIYVICRSGARSLRAAEFLAERLGLSATNVAGGTLAWLQAGREVVTGPEPA